MCNILNIIHNVSARTIINSSCNIVKEKTKKEIIMEKVQIQWGDLSRTEAIENDVFTKAKKILEFAPTATTLNVNLKVINPSTSAGIPTQAVNMELRLPNHQDVRSEKESDDLYRSIKEAQKAILSQVKTKKEKNLI